MSRNSVNLLVDSAVLIVFVALAASGLLLEYKLGRGTQLLGFTRHDISVLHLLLGIIFLAGVVVHLLLHIDWIRLALGPRWGAPSLFALLFTILLFGLVLAAFMAPVSEASGGRQGEGHQHGWNRGRDVMLPLEDAA